LKANYIGEIKVKVLNQDKEELFQLRLDMPENGVNQVIP
jgi:hypothetical protein